MFVYTCLIITKGRYYSFVFSTKKNNVLKEFKGHFLELKYDCFAN